MRLLRVDAKTDTVTEIKTFEPLKSKYAAIATAMEQDPDGGKFLLDEGDGGYYEFDVQLGENGEATPHFLPGNEGYHEGVPEKHLARIQRNPDSLKETKEKYGDFLLDTPGAAPDENPFNAPPAPSQEELDAMAEAEGREELEPNAPEETVDAVTEGESTETESVEGVEGAEGESAEAEEVTTEPLEGAEETNAVEEIVEETEQSVEDETAEIPAGDEGGETTE